MSESRNEGSSQAAKADSNTQTPSNWKGAHPKLRDQLKKKKKSSKKVFKILQEKMLKLQHVVTDQFLQWTNQQMQCLSLGDQQCTRASRNQEKKMGHLLSQIVNLVWSNTVRKLKFQVPLPCSDSRCAIKAGHQALSSWQTGQPRPRLGDLEAAFASCTLSKRGTDIYEFYHLSFQSYDAYQTDKYHKDENPLGYINLSTIENKLCLDLVTARLTQSDMNCLDEAQLQYSDWKGQPFLREELASFLTHYCKAPTPLDPENVVVLNNCSSIFSSLAMVLCDPGDALLIPTPCYSSFPFSSYFYSKVELVPVYLESQVTGTDSYSFQLTVDKLKLALTQAKKEAKNVKGIVLINPQNPLSGVYTQLSLQKYLVFAKKHKLHVIVDENYMLSVFEPSATFQSVLSIKDLPDPNMIHIIWDTSKDFGISGFRLGVLYTHNKEVASAMKVFGYYHGVSDIAQYKLWRLLQDKEWINKVYLPKNHSRLRKAYSYVMKILEDLKIPFCNCGSGLFVWINLKAYLSPCTFEQEQILYQRFQDNKLLISSGQSYKCIEPGWFCLVFAENHLQLQVGMDRFCHVLAEHKQGITEEQEQTTGT
ncbi:probable inactive 1-aminocyclopropane-1-carboxylate synthase-like protein 2 [Grammomys surdaster]|uniref:probable inactive 1-aminocyclopropane-1-carboxylate synthase-like protein 2 n=1 Tax=Grammomys surdaster TaxID=491861 RepID=UPI00109F1272|nr:probable inactive 1-aminocyclopropane-1-carboxylate synthase-like protein 2 [Grammomys surdaster]